MLLNATTCIFGLCFHLIQLETQQHSSRVNFSTNCINGSRLSYASEVVQLFTGGYISVEDTDEHKLSFPLDDNGSIFVVGQQKDNPENVWFVHARNVGELQSEKFVTHVLCVETLEHYNETYHHLNAPFISAVSVIFVVFSSVILFVLWVVVRKRSSSSSSSRNIKGKVYMEGSHSSGPSNIV